MTRSCALGSTVGLVVFISFAVLGSAEAQSAGDLSTTRIEQDIDYGVPLSPCGLPSVVAMIARATQIPAGVEHVPGNCVVPAAAAGAPAPARERVFLLGVSVAAALDDLVARDPRYAWRMSDGVIVVRPVEAWSDRDHFLHRVLPSIAVENGHLGAALNAWRDAFSSSRRASRGLASQAMRTTEGNRTFSVELHDAPAILALDAFARAHGALRWEVSYCLTARESRFATVRMWTLEHDPTGIGVPMPDRQRVVDGKVHDACAQVR